MAINLVVLTGRVTADLELKYTQSGKGYCKFGIAVGRRYNRDEVDFVNIVTWEKRAELAANHLNKGSLVGITGSLRTRTYEDEKGIKRKITEIIADNIEFLEPKRDGVPSSKPVSEPSSANEVSDDDFPF